MLHIDVYYEGTIQGLGLCKTAHTGSLCAQSAPTKGEIPEAEII